MLALELVLPLSWPVKFSRISMAAPYRSPLAAIASALLWNRNTSAIHAARAARDQAQVLREKTQAQISADIAGARLDFRESHERANAYGADLTAKSANVLQTVGYSYEHGGASLLELLAAERNDNDIRLAAARAQADAASATFALSAALNCNGSPASFGRSQ